MYKVHFHIANIFQGTLKPVTPEGPLYFTVFKIRFCECDLRRNEWWEKRLYLVFEQPREAMLDCNVDPSCKSQVTTLGGREREKQASSVDGSNEPTISAQPGGSVHSPYVGYWNGRRSRYRNVLTAATLRIS